MDDIKLALLGDKEAAKRLTDEGVLLPCPKCGMPGEAYKYPGKNWRQPYTAKCKKNDCFWIGKDYPTKKQAIKEWNTRAPVLTQEEIETLEGVK